MYSNGYLFTLAFVGGGKRWVGGVVAGTKVQKQQLRKKNKKDVRRGKKKRRSSKTGSVCSIFENEGVSLVVRINSITSCIERGNNVRSLFLCTFCYWYFVQVCCVWWQSAHVDVNTVGIMMHPSSPITSSWSKILTSWKHDFNYFNL